MGKESHNVIAFIPARGGSKSIPYKNIKPIAGRPLIYWVLDAAVNCKAIEAVYVSTDDDRIEDAITRYGSGKVILYRRSPATATDTASTESAMIEFAEKTDFDTIMLIQATSPLLKTEHLDGAIEKFRESEADSLLSVVRQKRFIWEEDTDTARPANYDPARRPLRQDFEGFFVENGAFYITNRKNLLTSGSRLSGNIALYEMPGESYHELDEPDDWPVVEQLLVNRQNRPDLSRLRNVNLFVSDVDGVLTDAGMYYSEKGDELKKFNTRDGKAFELLRNAGIITAIITSENTAIVANRARKLRIDHLYQGVSDKANILQKLCKELQVDSDDVVYIGDDINDLQVMQQVGFSASPFDASPVIKNSADYICTTRGGEGCVREVVDLILSECDRHRQQTA